EPVFLRARRLAHEHPLRLLVADAENRLAAPGAQLAIRAAGDFRLQLRPVHHGDVVARPLRLLLARTQPPNGSKAHLPQYLAAPAHNSSVSTRASSRPSRAG